MPAEDDNKELARWMGSVEQKLNHIEGTLKNHLKYHEKLSWILGGASLSIIAMLLGIILKG